MSELDRRRGTEYALGGGVKVYEVTFGCRDAKMKL